MTNIALKGGYTTTDRRLDRIPQNDPRNQNYQIRRLFAKTQTPRTYTWAVGPTLKEQTFLDQGQEGACVGFSFTHELIARPSRVPANAEVAYAVYRGAQRIDEWPGEDYDGTSVIAGVQYLKNLGYYSSYAWTKSAWELAVVVSRNGPCVIGVNWKEGMFEPDSHGFLNANGHVMGGHAILVKGYNLRRRTADDVTPAFTLHNSWGESWGVNGCAYLSLDDMQQLLNEDGDACLPMRTPYDMAIVR